MISSPVLLNKAFGSLIEVICILIMHPSPKEALLTCQG